MWKWFINKYFFFLLFIIKSWWQWAWKKERKVGVTFSVIYDTKTHFSWRWIGNQCGRKAWVYRQANLRQKSPVCPIPAVWTSGLTLQTLHFLVYKIGSDHLPPRNIVSVEFGILYRPGVWGLLGNWHFNTAMACLQQCHHCRGGHF